MQSWITRVRKGFLEFCLLAMMRNEEVYGLQLAQKLSDLEGSNIPLNTIYLNLRRLAKEGLVKSALVALPSGPPRRYYSLTSLGRERLAEMEDYWANIIDSIDELMGWRKD